MQNIETLTQKTAKRIKSKLKSNKRKKYDLAYRKNIKSVNCTFTHEEYKTLVSNANKAGLRPTRLLKDSALAYIDDKLFLPLTIEQSVKTVVSLMNGISRNLNQIAKHTNTVKNATIIDLIKAKENVKKLTEDFKAFFRNPKNFE